SLASFASICAISAESGFDFAFAPVTGLAAFGASACCASRRPPVTATVATRKAALIFNLVVHMAFNTPSGKEDSFKEDTFIENMPVLLCVHDDSVFGLSRSSILHKRGRSVIYGAQGWRQDVAARGGGVLTPLYPGGSRPQRFFSRSLMRGISKALRRVARFW